MTPDTILQILDKMVIRKGLYAEEMMDRGVLGEAYRHLHAANGIGMATAEAAAAALTIAPPPAP